MADSKQTPSADRVAVPEPAGRERHHLVIALGDGEKGRLLRHAFGDHAALMGETVSAWARRTLSEACGHEGKASLVGRVERLERALSKARRLK